MYMNLKKRILVCIILLLFLAVMCMIGVFSQRSIQAMGNAIQEADSKKIALTFDDGPHPYYTQQLLKGLK